MEQYFSFNPREFDKNGDNVTSGHYFLYFLEEWEKQFHDSFKPFFATHFYGNTKAMSLIDACLVIPETEKCGMDLFDGEINEQLSWKIEKHSKYSTIYAISSSLIGNDDEPLFLINDPSLKDGKVLLKYKPDNDGGDEELIPEPEFVGRKVKI